jgi:predicted ATP-grasp superfamily ATP-dependent carboligase
VKIFLYEYATAGGAWDNFHNPQLVEELRTEGQAMQSALAADLSKAGHDVLLLADATDRRRGFHQLVTVADAVILLAPEIGGILLHLAKQVEHWQGRLLSPNSRFIEIAANKHSTAEHLRARNVPAPPGIVLRSETRCDDLQTPWDGPTICKPIDGAGSWGVKQVEALPDPLPYAARLEQFCGGIPASVAVLCGPAQRVALVPCRQYLGGQTGFCYLGGALPLAKPHSNRAQSLALHALQHMPPTVGYVGVDLVLGPSDDGSQDSVIEVNPRLTTSYVGLRRAYRQNLAEAWLKIAAGTESQLSFDGGAVEFLANGTVRQLDSKASFL